MKEAIIDELKGNSDVSEYAVLSTFSEGVSMRTIRDYPPKSISSSRGTQHNVTVINHHGEGEEKTSGTSADDILEGQSIDGQISILVENAKSQNNPRIYVPSPPAEGYTNVQTSDPAIIEASNQKGGLERIMKRWQDAFNEAAGNIEGISISSLEMNLGKTSEELVTSTGIQIGREFTDVDLELTLLAARGDEEADYVVTEHVRNLAGINPAEIVKKYGELAMAKLGAGRPKGYEGPVVIIDDALHEMILAELLGIRGPIVYHASGKIVYSGSSLYELGKSVLVERVPKEDGAEGFTTREREILGDRFTLISDPFVEHGLRSTPYAPDGTPTRRATIIKDSVLDTFYADTRFAHYLGIEPTGTLGNVVMLAGNTSTNDLVGHDKPLVVVQQFSSFSPDLASGDFSSEVRSGYELQPDGTRVPVSGGFQVCGNIFEAFANMRLSEETMTRGNYSGPSAIRFNNLKVSGE